MQHIFVILGAVCTLSLSRTKKRVKRKTFRSRPSDQEPENAQDSEETEETEETGVKPNRRRNGRTRGEQLLSPDLLQCASQNMNGQTIRMSLQNIHGLAYTELQWGHTHAVEGLISNEIMENSIHQSLPIS